jgi:trigger factor
VTDAAIDRTIDILRKQRRTFAQCAAGEGAAEGDRVTIDFEGKIDGEPFAGGKAEGFQFIIGEGQMLEQFDAGRARHEAWARARPSRSSFPTTTTARTSPARTADFLVTDEEDRGRATCREVDDAFAQALGIKEATVEGLRARRAAATWSARSRFRVQARNKAAVMDALLASAEA